MERGRERDAGFTLVELLIVIVILGVLSTVTVFAVRGITDRGQESACEGDFGTIVRAQEAHDAFYGGFADAPTLVSVGLLASEPTLFAITGDADSYTVAPAADSTCTQTGGASPVAAPVVNPPTAAGPDGTADPPGDANHERYGDMDGWEWWVGIDTPGGKPHDEIVVLGRGEAAAAYIAMEAAAPATSRRITLVNLDDATTSRLRSAVARARNNGDTIWVVFTGDDTVPLDDGSTSVDEWMSSSDPNDVHVGVIGDDAYPDDVYHPLPPGGDLIALVETYG